MKKLAAYNILWLAILASCYVEDVQLDRPDQRLKVILDEYQSQLVNSDFGWEAYLYPGLGGGFTFYMQFTPEGRVTMLADIDKVSATEAFESSYKLKAIQRPSLFFDTYSYIHMLSDPDNKVLGGVYGQGYFSDFEFSFVRSSADTIFLEGNFNSSELILVRSNSERAEAYKAGSIVSIVENISQIQRDQPFQYLQFDDGKKVSIVTDQLYKSYSIIYQEGGSFASQTERFSYTSKGLFFSNEIKYGSNTFRELYLDETTNQLFASVNGKHYNVKYSPDPILPLHAVLGVGFSTIRVPWQAGTPGKSSLFTSIWASIRNSLGAYGISLSDMDIRFDTNESLMLVRIYFNFDGTTYVAQYPYSYTQSTNGVFKFTEYGEPNLNGAYFKFLTQPLLDLFTQDRFRMEYLETTYGYWGKMLSLETDTFFFSGILQ